MDEIKNEEIKSVSVATSDEKLEVLQPSAIIADDDSSKSKKQKKNKKEKVEKKPTKKEEVVEEKVEVEDEDKPPYKNMKARKIVFIIGFILCSIGFALMVFSLVSLLVPNDFATRALFIPIDIVSCSVSFVGCVFAVAGANTAKGLAKLSFFFCTLGFILSAGMLVVMLITKLIPFEMIQALLGK